MLVAEKISQKKESLHKRTMLLADEFKNEIPEKFIYRLEDILVDFVADSNSKIYQLEETKVDRSDIRLLINKMDEGFKQMDKRFEAMQTQMDKRFEAMQTQMDNRFEAIQIQIDNRFEAIQTQMDKRFEAVDKHFEAVDKRFEAVDKRFEDINKRFEDINKRFEDMNKRFNFIQWLIVFSFLFLGTLMSVFQFINKS